MVGHFLQTIPKSKCTEFQPIWTALPEVIRTFMRFLGAKNPHRKYKGFRPMVKTLPYVFSHNFWTGRFQTKYDHFLKTRKIDLKHITRRKKKLGPPAMALKSFCCKFALKIFVKASNLGNLGWFSLEYSVLLGYLQTD